MTGPDAPRRAPQITDEEIEESFRYHPPSPEGAARHEELAQGFVDLMRLCNRVMPDGREKALVKTHLEDAKMRASKGVALDPETR